MRFAIALLIAIHAPAALAASDVSVSKHKLEDGRHALSHEVVVDAPVERVWAAIATADGWESWAVPVAWDHAPDVIESSYDKAAKPGDPTTIRQQILFRAPRRLMLFRTVKAPDGFPDFDTYSKVTSLFELEPLGDTRTRVRLTGSGYADSDAGRKLVGFFEAGNKVSLERLRDSFPAVPQAPLAKGLEPLAFLAGHCWRGEFPGGTKIDTHCFEAVYGGAHIRDRHEVLGGKEVYRGETVYSWNARLGQVEYTYWNSLGGVSRGTMALKDGLLDFGNESYTGSDGKTMTIATAWRPGIDSYEVISTRNGVTGAPVTVYRRAD
jgi:uncharacterized protein YndB with AHSA1/START domain